MPYFRGWKCKVPEALGAVQDVLVTLTSLLVAEANIVGLADWLDSEFSKRYSNVKRMISSLLV
jgi:hypothetical protein